MPAVEDQLLSKGGIRVTGAGEAAGRIMTSDANGVGSWQPPMASAVGLETTPIGSIMPHGGALAPSGWLLCDGTAVSRVTYTSLFNAIGTVFGAGDGATTFNLPDLRGRSPLGAGTGAGLTARALGAIGGEELHTLTAAESGMPAHSHTIADPGHNHGAPLALAASTGHGAGTYSAWVSGTDGWAGAGANNGSYIPTGTTGVTVNNSTAVNASSSHNTMHPFTVVNFIIKAVPQAAGQQFTLAAGAVPAVRARRGTNQSIPSAAWTSVSFDQVRWDTDSMWSSGTPTKITIRTPGIYQINGGVLLAGGNAGTFRLGVILINGVAVAKDGESLNAQFGTAGTFIAVNGTYKLNAGDLIDFQLYQDSGVALNALTDASNSIELAVTWIGEGRGVVGDQIIPSARVRPTAVQTIPNAATTAVTFAASRWDTDSMFAVASPTRLTIRTPGIYSVGGTTYFAANANGDRAAGIRVNGGNITWASLKSPGADLGRVNPATHLTLNAGDYIELVVYQNSGGNLDLQNASAAGNADWSTELWATLIGPPAKAVIPYVRVRKSANQAIAPDNWRVIAWDIEDSDNDGIHDNVTTNTRLTCRTPGVYHISGGVTVNEAAGAANFRRLLGIFKNGAEVSRIEYSARDALSGGMVEANLELIVGDYVELMFYSVTDNTATVTAASQLTHFEMVKIGLSGQSGVSGGTQWAQNGADIQPTNAGQVRLPNGLYHEAWHNVGAAGEPAFQSGHTNLDAATYSAASFLKMPDGTVRVRGLVKKNDAATQGVVFTLPVGYRPLRRALFICVTGGATGVARVDISTAGDVQMWFGDASAYLSLDNISFVAEQ